MKTVMLLFAITLMAFTPDPKSTKADKIQIALLLDTSNSMDGLIEQAKGKLWSIVNEFNQYEKKGKTPDIEIALYEYGNDGLAQRNNWILQVLPFTTDLDLISEKLFALTTNGGSEYCGSVIHSANIELEWSKRSEDLRLIFIAGNEGFDQGNFSYREACSESKNKDVAINTIFCGGYEDGIRALWKEGASCGEGKYINIDQDRKVSYIETPYDDRIDKLNGELNETYLWYGSNGYNYITNQAVQDANASSFSKANKADRAVSKSSKNYKNSHWDVLDAVENEEISLEEIVESDQLDPELKGKSKEEVEKILKEKSEKRKEIQTAIKELSKKRSLYIAENSKDEDNTLEQAIKRTVADLALKKQFCKKVE